ncbi:MAG TPA: DUF3603 family protein [Bacillota bacterium]|nr:DUF3603 family protein [Bacillota bacterium]
MIYLHDVWVNWFEGEENSYNICHYHEWRKNDHIQLLEQIPLLYISFELYEYMTNDLQEIPYKLLESIYRRAYLRKRQTKEVIEFAAVITDGRDIMAFDTIGYEIPVRKSRLIPRQEKQVFRTIKRLQQQTFQFQLENYEKTYHLLSMEPKLIIGLTRRERNLKQVLMMALDQLRAVSHLEELRYWLTEWDPKRYETIRSMDAQQVWQTLYDGIKVGWTKNHLDFGEKLVRSYPFLQEIWRVELLSQEEKPSVK